MSLPPALSLDRPFGTTLQLSCLQSAMPGWIPWIDLSDCHLGPPCYWWEQIPALAQCFPKVGIITGFGTALPDSAPGRQHSSGGTANPEVSTMLGSALRDQSALAVPYQSVQGSEPSTLGTGPQQSRTLPPWPPLSE